MSFVENLGQDPATALPRSNGELVFEAPWQSRAFGMAAALADRGAFEWNDFQQSLIATIAAHEQSGDSRGPYEYYMHWLAALERLVEERGLVGVADLDARAVELSHRPSGYDHAHRHEHDHDHHHGHGD